MSKHTDPLNQNGREIFTVKKMSDLNGTTPNGGYSESTSDKRIGCVPVDRR